MAGERRTATVTELQRDGILLVEDGNHGEYRPRPDEFVDRGVAFIRAADMDAGRVLFESSSKINERARQRITKGIGAPGDVLLSHKGTVGKVALVPDDAPPFVCSPQTTFWRTLDQDRLDRKFLYAFLRSSGFHAQLATRAGETDMAPYVSLTSQRGLSVTLPPIGIQRAIAHILGTLDDKIELNRRMNETLEAMARALFKSWFVDFDPVRAKAEGRQPSGMDATTAALFPDSFQDSPLEKIPRGWSAGKVSELVNLSRDGITPTDFPSEVFDHYSVPAFDEGRLPKAEVGEIIKSNKFFVPDSAVLLSKLNPRIPRVWLPTVSKGRRSVCSTEFFVAIPNGANRREFVYGLFSSPPFWDVFTTMVTGTSGSHQRVQPESLLAMDTVIPPVNLRNSFADVARSLLLQISHNLEQSRTLAPLRDALLPKLISGEIPVNDAEGVIARGNA